MLPINETERLERKVVGDMEGIGVPVHVMTGNYDYNYFHGNPEIRYPDRPQYYAKSKLWLVFLDSFDPKEQKLRGYECEKSSHLKIILLSR